MTIKLPRPVAEYFSASNANDVDRLAASFAPDARVHDEKEDHVGQAAIRQWAIGSRKKYNFQSEPFAREGDDNAPIVRAHVTGDFPGNPVDLTYRFTVAGGSI